MKTIDQLRYEFGGASSGTIEDYVYQYMQGEMHEYGKHLQGKVIDLEFDIQKLNREILLLESKNEELKDDFMSEQEENSSLRSRLSDIEERAKEMGWNL